MKRTVYKIKIKENGEWVDHYGGISWEDKSIAESCLESLKKFGEECYIVGTTQTKYEIKWYCGHITKGNYMGSDDIWKETLEEACSYADWHSGGFSWDVVEGSDE